MYETVRKGLQITFGILLPCSELPIEQYSYYLLISMLCWHRILRLTKNFNILRIMNNYVSVYVFDCHFSKSINQSCFAGPYDKIIARSTKIVLIEKTEQNWKCFKLLPEAF